MGDLCPTPGTTVMVEPLPVGRIFEGSAVRTGDELNAAVVLLALDRGWQPTPGECWHRSPDALRRTVRAVSGWFDNGDDSDALLAVADSAVQWLDEHAVPPGHVIVWDDGLDVLPADEASE